MDCTSGQFFQPQKYYVRLHNTALSDCAPKLPPSIPFQKFEIKKTPSNIKELTLTMHLAMHPAMHPCLTITTLFPVIIATARQGHATAGTYGIAGTTTAPVLCSASQSEALGLNQHLECCYSDILALSTHIHPHTHTSTHTRLHTPTGG